MRKKVIIGLLSACALLLVCAAALLFLRVRNAERYTKQLSLGEKYLREMDYENAELCYRRALAIDEKKAAAYLNLSAVYAQQGAYSEAEEILEKAQEAGAAESPDAGERLRQQEELLKEMQREAQKAEQDGGREETAGGTGNGKKDEGGSAGEEENKDREPTEHAEQTKEKDQGLYAMGRDFVTRNGWTYMDCESGIYIFKDGEEGMQDVRHGNISDQMMAVDDGVYYGYDDQTLCFYSWKTGKDTAVYTGSGYVEPAGISEKYLYFTEAPQRDADVWELVQMRLADGTMKRFSTPDFCMHSDLLLIGERIFFSVGVADIGTSGLMELDPETGSITEREAHIKSELVSSGNTLYYNRTDEAGDYSKLDAELVAWNIETDEKRVLMRQNGQALGMNILITGRAVYTAGSKLQRVEDDTAEVIAESIAYQPWADGDSIYYMADGALFRYDELTRESGQVRTMGEGDFVLGISAGYLYYYAENEGYIQEKL